MRKDGEPCARREPHRRTSAWGHRPYTGPSTQTQGFPCDSSAVYGYPCTVESPVHVSPIATDATPRLACQGMSRRCCHPSTRPSPGLGRGGIGRHLPLGRGAALAERIPQDAPGERTGMAPIFEQHLAIHDSVVDALGEFAPPAPSRKIVHRIFRQRVDGVRIKDRDVGRDPSRSRPRS